MPFHWWVKGFKTDELRRRVNFVVVVRIDCGPLQSGRGRSDGYSRHARQGGQGGGWGGLGGGAVGGGCKLNESLIDPRLERRLVFKTTVS